MDAASDYARTVTERNAAKPSGRAAVKTVEVESAADAQKRRDLANESPIDREMRLKRESKAAVESPVVLKPKE